MLLVGTVNNRTDAAHEFETAISAQGLHIEGEATQRVTVPAGGEKTVSWTIVADTLPESGEALITGRTLASDAPPDRGPEFSDAVRVPVRVVPDGVAQRIVSGGVLAREETVTLDLPSDRIEPASSVSVTVRAGLKQVVDGLADDVLTSGRYGSPGAADQLLVAAIPGHETQPKAVRESLALLSRYQGGTGAWGWWEEDPPDPVITSKVLLALAEARAAGIAVPIEMVERGVSGAIELYNQTNLWEHRAQLASAIAMSESPRAQAEEDEAKREEAELLSAALSRLRSGRAALPPGLPPPPGLPVPLPRGRPQPASANLLEEVHRRATHLSPYAELLLASAYAKAGHEDWACEIAAKALENAVTGPRIAYLPEGDHPGWSATSMETTAQALSTLVGLSQDPALQANLAQWLAEPEEHRWKSQDESAVAASALAAYLRVHPQPASLGDLEITFNGTRLTYSAEAGKPVQATVPRSLLQDSNRVILRRSGDGEAFFSIEARVFRPADDATANGITVLRRYEARNAAGLWDEVSGPIKAADPIRCTVLIWSDTRPDALRISEPIPAGFEFVDSEHGGYAREEVRDGAVIHYLRASGNPVFFRYYLRAESEGAVTALPALAEALRRPAVRGTTAPLKLEVKE